MVDVLIVDEPVAGKAIQAALYPLSSHHAVSEAEARGFLPKAQYRVALVGIPRIRIMVPQIRLAPPSLFARARNGMLRKPFSQLDLALALEEIWNQSVVLEPLGRRALLGTHTLGHRGFVIAQVAEGWGWTQGQAEVFHTYLCAPNMAETSRALGVSRSVVTTELTRATKRANEIMGCDLRAPELRYLLLSRAMPD